MRLSSTQEINAPIDFVFGYLSDFETHIVTASGYGAEVERVDNSQDTVIGAKWSAVARIRGKVRDFDVELVSYDPTSTLGFAVSSPNADIDVEMQLVALGVSKTQVKIVAKSRPKSIAARLLLQTAKLAKKSISRRFDLRVRDLMGRIEDDYSELV